MARKIIDLNSATSITGTNIVLVHQNGEDKISTIDLVKAYTDIHSHNRYLINDGNDSTSGSLTAALFIGNLTGNADTATALETSRTISLSGDASGSTSFDGTGNATITVSVANADTATALETPRTIGLSGDASGSTSFDGTGNATISVSVANADTATALETLRTISVSGDASGFTSFDGTANKDIALTITSAAGNFAVVGDFTVSGTTTTVDTETITITDNIIEINSSQTGTPQTSLIGGIEVNRGSSTNYRFIFEELTDVFTIGEIGNEQAVATREDSPTSNAIPFWNDSARRLDSSSVTVSGSTLTGSLNGLASSATTAAALTGSQANAIGFNTTHRGSNGSDHSIIGTNTSAIGLNTTHRGSNGSDHSIIGTNTSAIGLNTTHRGSNGSDHSIVGSNTSAIGLNTTHRGDNSQAHSDYLKNNAVDVGVGLTLTGDNSSADTAYVPMVLYGTDETPPAASGFPIGTLYIQYTA